MVHHLVSILVDGFELDRVKRLIAAGGQCTTPLKVVGQPQSFLILIDVSHNCQPPVVVVRALMLHP